MKYDIAVIIINFNTSGYTIDCIKSILDKTSPGLSMQIIIVDNASQKSDYLRIKEFLSTIDNEHITLFRSRINTGFGGGNMTGVQFSNARYYAFVNNDTLFEEDCLEHCFNFMELQEDAGVCGPKIIIEHKYQSKSFDHFLSLGKIILGSGGMEFLMPGRKPRRMKDYAAPLKVDYVNGSFMFFRANDFDNTGGFDTNLFLFFEESDICTRLKRKGRNTYYLPNVSYHHFEGKSQQNNIRKKIELKTAMLYVLRKHDGYIAYQIARIYMLLRYGLTILIKPKYFPLFLALLKGMPISDSMKFKQVILQD
ncbi:glycosyltransferase family 2 protein [Robertkochia solimangrovi]|uniref:glycosyltransferase family 2 protein n=1 Tax=Robertkochia solimangrovi TaxID=2213046 RepID=UPI0011813395|nr:glycosyltransferase family 2 protein [Robertkochia solimangrovi]TRZ42256.1 glycosyltransferase family 2 protein [Robertkochia solimangrovi]